MEQAAARLGVKPDAIRKRLRRGTLRGQRVGTTWDVWIDGPFHEPRAEPQDKPQATSHEPRDGLPAEPWRDALLEELRAEVAYLRVTLEREQVAHGETRRLMQQALDRLRLLPVPPVETVTTSAEPAENAPVPTEPPDTPPVDLLLVRELRRAGVKKKRRRKLLERLAGLWR